MRDNDKRAQVIPQLHISRTNTPTFSIEVAWVASLGYSSPAQCFGSGRLFSASALGSRNLYVSPSTGLLHEIPSALLLSLLTSVVALGCRNVALVRSVVAECDSLCGVAIKASAASYCRSLIKYRIGAVRQQK